MLAFLIYLLIAAPGEVNAFERATFVFFRLKYLLNAGIAGDIKNYGIPRQEFPDLLALQIESCLDYRSLARHDNNLVIVIIICGTYSGRIAEHPHVAVADNAAYHESAVPVGSASPQDSLRLDFLADFFRKFLTFKLSGILSVDPLAFHVKCMPELLKKDKRIGIDSRMLPGLPYLGKDLIDIGEVEVAAKEHVAGAPVVASEKRMHIAQSGTACCAVAQMPHIELTHKRNDLLAFVFVYFIVNLCQKLLDRIRSFCTLPEYVFLPGL